MVEMARDSARVIPRSPCLCRHLSEMTDRINKRQRANMKSRGHSQEIRAWPASSFGALRQFKNRIEATMHEQARHYQFPESLVATHWIRA
jgi:hypothetical protein